MIREKIATLVKVGRILPVKVKRAKNIKIERIICSRMRKKMDNLRSLYTSKETPKRKPKRRTDRNEVAPIEGVLSPAVARKMSKVNRTEIKAPRVSRR